MCYIATPSGGRTRRMAPPPDRTIRRWLSKLVSLEVQQLTIVHCAGPVSKKQDIVIEQQQDGQVGETASETKEAQPGNQFHTYRRRFLWPSRGKEQEKQSLNMMSLKEYSFCEHQNWPVTAFSHVATAHWLLLMKVRHVTHLNLSSSVSSEKDNGGSVHTHNSMITD